MTNVLFVLQRVSLEQALKEMAASQQLNSEHVATLLERERQLELVQNVLANVKKVRVSVMGVRVSVMGVRVRVMGVRVSVMGVRVRVMSGVNFVC